MLNIASLNFEYNNNVG